MLRKAVLALTLLACVTSACTGDIGDGDGSKPQFNVDPLGPPTKISGARRQSREELLRSMGTLFGSDVPVDLTRLPNDTLTPFDNDIVEQSPSMVLVESLESIGKEAADWITATPERMARIVPCQPASVDDLACFQNFVSTFGRRVIRRPLDEDERKPMDELLSYARDAKDFGAAVRMVVRVLLLHPEFIYRVEVGASKDGKRIQLSSYEVASRLAFLLQGRTPDEALLAKAGEGALDAREGLLRVVEELLTTPAAKEQARRFHAFWLGYSTLEKTDLQKKLRGETDALIDRVTEEGRDFRYLLLAEETQLDGELAAHYGLPAPAASGWVPYGSAPRVGILSHGTFAAAGAKFGDTSPTRRGKFIRERFLCQPIPLPPPEVRVDVDSAPVSKTPGACKSERYRQHRENPVCASCHGRMDPIGFGLENFDAAGRYRTTEKDKPECPIDGAGSLEAGQSFTGAKQLAPLLANSPRFVSCFSEHFVRFAVGRKLDTSDPSRIERLSADMAKQGNSFRGLVLAYVTNDNFHLREEE
jgi:Protein of unknown function (DUF1588)/Protein of unknown function (DUF1592)/Protein of unknown function (DUF1585)/Protein of unknown function (DUF1595)